jgi:hypothetical protein
MYDTALVSIYIIMLDTNELYIKLRDFCIKDNEDII